MCRFLAYRGDPIFLSDLVCAPSHSLVHQSLHAEQAKTGTNGDGFGIGWYGERSEPGLYREVRPFLRPCPRFDGHVDDAGELPPIHGWAAPLHA
jgi:predicted glutamine amidotransferase